MSLARQTTRRTAALVDFLLVRIPLDMNYNGEQQTGSWLTARWRSLDLPSDNWLSQYVKTSFDKVKEVAGQIDGFASRTHRLQTFGHDPLTGLVIGTIDIMRGGLTAVGRDGALHWLSNTGAAVPNPIVAFVIAIGHLLSDGFTQMGHSAPGWSLLQTLQVGSFGDKQRTIAELARFMYLKGYHSRHFLTMSTSVAAAELVLRSYFALRQKIDPAYGEQVSREQDVAHARTTGDHPRYQAKALGASLLGSAANAGKVAVYGGNPLAINYAQWLRFFHAAFVWYKAKLQSPSSVLQGHAYANWKELAQGWPAIDPADPDFPTLVVQ